MTLEAAGEAAGVSRATVNRYESNQGPVRWLVVEALCKAYGASEEEIKAAVALAKSAKIRSWWKTYGDAVPEYMAPRLLLEEEAAEEWHWANAYVPGLLQIRPYAESVHRAVETRATEEEIARMVDVRMKRQEILKRESPPHLWAIMDEAVIRREVGGPAVMAAQLDHLRTCSRAGLVTIQVLPFSAGAHAADPTGFVITKGAEASLDVVYISNLTGALFLEKPAELERHRIAFEYLRSQALPQGTSDEMIQMVGETYAAEAARTER
jgi:transcriptional regulator with XRE-family HTH domain